MKNKLVAIIIIVAVALGFAGCYYDKSELVYPPQTVCDTANVKYSVDIVSILSANCYSCHSGSAGAGAGIKLDAYSNLLIQVNNGKLEKAVTHSAGATPMPYNQPKLLPCTVNKIVAWIHQGAKNN